MPTEDERTHWAQLIAEYRAQIAGCEKSISTFQRLIDLTEDLKTSFVGRLRYFEKRQAE